MSVLRYTSLPLLLAGMLLVGCDGNFSDDSAVLATVNGEKITQADLDNYAEARQRQAPTGDMTPEQRKVVLDELVDRVLLTQHGSSLGFDKSKDVHFGVKRQRENLIAREFILDGLRQDFETKTAQMNKVDYKVRHILVKTENEAKQLAQRLKAGAKFEPLAKSKSLDIASGKEGGDLGWVNQTSGLVPEFIDGVVKLEKGQTSDPIKSEFGWHVIKVEDTRPLELPAFKDALNDPRMQGLLRQLQQDNMQDLQKTLKELKEKSKVEIKDAK
jgi:peptidyl-prolyl cis-trans isomerase C